MTTVKFLGDLLRSYLVDPDYAQVEAIRATESEDIFRVIIPSGSKFIVKVSCDDSRSADKNGRPYARLADLKEGDEIELDDDFTCASGVKVVKRATGGLYFDCAAGRHYLHGQLDGEHLVGVYMK